MASIQNLKTVQPYYNDVKYGLKKFEVRNNDRGFQVGDTLLLYEYNAEIEMYTGYRIPPLEVTYILDNPHFCKEGYVVIGFEALQGLQEVKVNVFDEGLPIE